jgi:Fe2+ transport system protein B
MSKERVNTSPEREINIEALAEAGAERHEQLREQIEKNVETKHENINEIAQEARERALSHEKQEKNKEEVSPAERRRPVHNRKTEEASFSATMKEVQSQMSAPDRAFSKIIHNKAVEKVSEGVGNTVARPNAILSGAIVAFALTLGIYLLAKNLGYPLSGFETIAAFLLGWILGIAYDFLKVMVTGRQ